MKKTLLGSATGFAGSGLNFFAATCGTACAATCGTICLPAASTFLGITSSGLGLWLQEWKPALIAASCLAFGYAFYDLYRREKDKPSCQSDCHCETPRHLKLQKGGLWLSLVVSVSFFVYPVIAGKYSSQDDHQNGIHSAAILPEGRATSSCDTTQTSRSNCVTATSCNSSPGKQAYYAPGESR